MVDIEQLARDILNAMASNQQNINGLAVWFCVPHNLVEEAFELLKSRVHKDARLDDLERRMAALEGLFTARESEK